MGPRSEIRLYDVGYNEIARFDNWRTLSYTKKVNDFGYHQLDIDASDGGALLDMFGLDYMIEIWRWDDDNGIAPYIDYGPAFHRTTQRQLTERQLWIGSCYGRGLEDLLRRRSVLYRAGTAQATKAGAGETVMKEYVTQNVGSGATLTPRLAAGVTTGFNVEANSGRGTYWSGAKAYQNVLDVVKGIATVSGVDFDVVFTGTRGAPSFEFRCYYPQRGTDRTEGTLNPAVFNPLLGNMLSPSYTFSRTEEVNALLVLGQGQEAARAYLEVTRPTTGDSPWNRREQSRDARNVSTLAGLQTEGQQTLSELAAREAYNFEVLQTAGLVYGRDYFLGDLVTASFGGITRNKKIVQVDVTISNNKEELSFTFAEINQS